MEAFLSELDEPEREALVTKYLALQASQPQPRGAQDGYLFMYELVDRTGQLTEAGIDAARDLEQSGHYAHLAPATEPCPAENTSLLAELRLLAEKAGGWGVLRLLIDRELGKPGCHGGHR
jgi:hypothetical protein